MAQLPGCLPKAPAGMRIHCARLTAEAAGYLQVVASRNTRIRLAQFRTGSHWLGVETGLIDLI